MSKPRLQVQTMKTSDLIPYARNAKQHPDEQVAQIAASIREFGMNDPVAVWHDKDGTPVIILYETIVYPLITRHVIKWAKTLD
jgi:hypothetical protein